MVFLPSPSPSLLRERAGVRVKFKGPRAKSAAFFLCKESGSVVAE
jgi:hypothetical protein